MSGAVLGLITARGGSQRLPGKNLAELGGRSLLQRTIDAALASASIDRLIVSSDDPAILAAAKAGGAEAPFVRPSELAGPTATSIDVVRHAMDWADVAEPDRFGMIVLLQPTSPLRSAADIEAVVALCRAGRATAVSVAPYPKPETLLLVNHAGGSARRVADQGQVCAVNGAVYAASWRHLRAGGGLLDEATAFYEMPWVRSVDIDTAADFALARALLESVEGEEVP